MNDTIDLTLDPGRTLPKSKHYCLKSLTSADYLLHQQYQRELEKSNNVFSDWVAETNSQLIEDIFKFIDSSLECSSPLFPNLSHANINVASVLLGIHTSDHELTLDLIRKKISRTYKLVQIARVEPDIDKKSSVISKFEDYLESNQLLVLIEQTEKMDLHVLEFMMLYLLSKLDRDLKKKALTTILVIFCKSSTRFPVERLFNRQISSRMLFATTIIKDPKINAQSLFQSLFDSENTNLILGPRVRDHIELVFTSKDPSVFLIQRMWRYILHLHYNKYTSLAPSLNEDALKQLSKEIHLLDMLKNLESMKYLRKDLKIDFDDPKVMLKFCKHQLKYLRQYDNFIKLQMYSYYELIQDKATDGFPSSINDIYSHLVKKGNFDLGSSRKFIDCISSLDKYKLDSLNKRIDSALKRGIMPKTKIVDLEDVNSILNGYRNKLTPESDPKKTLTELKNRLIRHTSILKNPINIPLSEMVYFNDIEPLIRLNLTQRKLVRECQEGYSRNFNLLTRLIDNCKEEINLADLYDEFKNAAESRPSNKKNLTEIVDDGNRNRKQRKSARISKHVVPIQPIEVVQEVEEDDDNLLRMQFQDILADQELHGFIKRDSRTSKKGKTQRIIWLSAPEKTT